MKSPFDGEISAYYNTKAPSDVRHAIDGATKGVMFDPAFPHQTRLKKKHIKLILTPYKLNWQNSKAWSKKPTNGSQLYSKAVTQLVKAGQSNVCVKT